MIHNWTMSPVLALSVFLAPFSPVSIATIGSPLILLAPSYTTKPMATPRGVHNAVLSCMKPFTEH